MNILHPPTYERPVTLEALSALQRELKAQTAFQSRWTIRVTGLWVDQYGDLRVQVYSTNTETEQELGSSLYVKGDGSEVRWS